MHINAFLIMNRLPLLMAGTLDGGLYHQCASVCQKGEDDKRW